MENNSLDTLRPFIGQDMSQSISPLGRWLNGVLRAVHEDGVEVAFTVRPEMTNPAQILHGGAIASMLDDCIGMTVMFSMGFDGSHFYSSVNLQIDFLGSARMGDEVIVRSKIVKAGRQIVNAEGWLHHSSGKLLAHATTNMLKVVLRT
ncbi:MAG: PaaI family thioesterase [Anaerolineae bacterium]|nr:PaaI family thioesterase [Anaerolineae bacterium]